MENDVALVQFFKKDLPRDAVHGFQLPEESHGHASQKRNAGAERGKEHTMSHENLVIGQSEEKGFHRHSHDLRNSKLVDLCLAQA